VQKRDDKNTTGVDHVLSNNTQGFLLDFCWSNWPN